MREIDAPALVLVLDDEPALRLIIRTLLTREGHRTLEAANLEEARALLQSEPVEVVLCDISLAGQSGLNLLREIAPRAPEVVVIMMTGNQDPTTVIHCLRSGAFDYVIKPVEPVVFGEVVQRVLKRQRSLLSERDRIEEQLRVLGKFSSENPNPVLRVHRDGRLLYANPASVDILAELGLAIDRVLPDFLLKLIEQARTADRIKDCELAVAGCHYSLSVTPIKGADYVYLYGHDISTLKRAEKDLIRMKDKAQKLALYDGLTGLPNRTLLEDRFNQELAFCKRHGTKLGVAFVDLDRFKEINDTQGHKAGDHMLVLVAKRLRESVRKTDTVARWGGDEFILLLPGIDDLQSARSVCETIKSRVQDKLAASEGMLVTMSMGAAICPDDADEPDGLLQAADAALLMAKARARNEVIVFGESGEVKSFRQQTVARALLRQAVSDRQIEVHYQPIVDTQSGSIVGAEALARWRNGDEGWVSPEMFIPMAEKLGLIDELGRQVQDSALEFVRDCHAQGFFISLSINISLRQLLHAEFGHHLATTAEKNGIAPHYITVELTESHALLGFRCESNQLKDLAATGFHLSIDDFGRGHSSLASLHEMPVEELKIDLNFVRNIHTDKGRRIVQTIVNLSRILGMETVAEGVETSEQLQTLRDLGVTRLQGYLFSRPVPNETFLGLFKKLGVRSVAHRPTPDSRAMTLEA